VDGVLPVKKFAVPGVPLLANLLKTFQCGGSRNLYHYDTDLNINIKG
jgi:hypothetical protein